MQNAEGDTRPKIALVTGAGSGIGRLTAVALMKSGWTVVLAGRTSANLDATLSMAGNGQGWVQRTDVTDETSVNALFSRIEKQHGRLDLLFNNAGVFSSASSIDKIDIVDWQRMIDTNLNGAFLCARGAFRMMKLQTPKGGRIINNGSVSAQVPRPSSGAYTAAKHAITGLTKAIALEGRAYDIACGQIDIGNAATELTTEIAAGMLQADGRVLAESVMDASHVARSVIHMASLPLSANIRS